MTVALLSVWGGQPPGTLYTTDAATETAMIAAKVATATLTGAVAWVPPGNSPGTGPTATYKTDPLTGRVGLVLPDGTTRNLQSVVTRKTGITDGLVQVADQVFGSLAIPAGILGAVDTIFRIQMAYGRDNNTDAYGSVTNFRMGTTGTVADSVASTQNASFLFPAASGGVSVGVENWFRVVSVGANSVVEKIGIANMGPSFSQASTSGSALGAQSTLTGYNLLTQAGFITVTTTMAAATATKPRSGYMSLELMP